MVNWNRADNEIALFALYAYADFSIPKNVDCIFELTNPESATYIDLELTLSLYEGWYPTNSIKDGHKHLCIFQFEKDIPPIFDLLHIGREKFSDVPKGVIKLGICHSDDFNEIKLRQ